MAVTCKSKPRAKPLDLDRRAAALGCTPGHLSQVLSGKRESRSLLVRLGKLIESERTSTQKKLQPPTRKNKNESKEIAHLVGREILAWFDPQNPEILVVTNPDRTNPICVARSENPNALESLIAPESGTLGRELARIEGQASYMKTRFNVVKAKFPMPQRQLLVDAKTDLLGHRISAQKNELAGKAESRQRQRNQADKFARRTGVALPPRAEENIQPEAARELADFLDEKEGQ